MHPWAESVPRMLKFRWGLWEGNLGCAFDLRGLSSRVEFVSMSLNAAEIKHCSLVCVGQRQLWQSREWNPWVDESLTHASLFPWRMFSVTPVTSFPSRPERTLCLLLHRCWQCVGQMLTTKMITLHMMQIVVYYFYLPVKKKEQKRNKCGSLMAPTVLVLMYYLLPNFLWHWIILGFAWLSSSLFCWLPILFISAFIVLWPSHSQDVIWQLLEELELTRTAHTEPYAPLRMSGCACTQPTYSSTLMYAGATI